MPRRGPPPGPGQPLPDRLDPSPRTRPWAGPSPQAAGGPDARGRASPRRAGGIPDRVGEEVIDGDGFLGRVDYLWPACNVAVETDGFRWHTSRHAWRRDGTKRNQIGREHD